MRKLSTSLLLLCCCHLLGQCPSSSYFALSEAIVEMVATPSYTGGLNPLHYSSSSGRYKVIFLVPGLNGDYNAWRDVRDETGGDVDEYQYYDARDADVRMFGTKYGPGYGQDAGLASAAKDVWDVMSSLNYTQLGVDSIEYNIAIGHSQGGLVLRAVEYATNTLGRQEYFGGLVTFGSPHMGAEILTNGLPKSLGGQGMLGDFMNDFCNDVTDGPLQEYLHLNNSFLAWLIRVFKLERNITNLKSELCRTLSDSIVPFYILDGYTANITQDYLAINEHYSGGNYLLSTLNNHTPSIPMVAFYGVEEEPVFWRQLSSITKKVHKYPAFQADPDQEMVDDYAKRLLEYEAKHYSYKHLSNSYQTMANTHCGFDNLFSSVQSWGLYTFLCPYQKMANRCKTVSNAYLRGAQFLKGANNRWKVIIGARKGKVVQQGYVCECFFIDEGTVETNIIQNATSCPLGSNLTSRGKRICQIYPNMILKVTEKENDGVVLAESAKYIPGGVVNPSLTDADYRMEATNHQQMRNCSETARKLNRVFSGNEFGHIFKTRKK